MEGERCVNIPVQKCEIIILFTIPVMSSLILSGENVPVTAPVEVPNEKCYKKPRKVCQTLVSTKPKVVTAKIPREHCGHKITAQNTKPKVKSTRDVIQSPGISRSSNQNTLNGDKNSFDEYFNEDLNRNDNFKQFYEYLLNQNSQNILRN